MTRLPSWYWRILRKEILARDPYCLNCRTERNPTIDHIIPLVCGGSHDPSNLQRLCEGCHNRKNKTSKNTHRLWAFGFLSEPEYHARLIKEAMQFQKKIKAERRMPGRMVAV